jgi:hypothetical protein
MMKREVGASVDTLARGSRYRFFAPRDVWPTRSLSADGLSKAPPPSSSSPAVVFSMSRMMRFTRRACSSTTAVLLPRLWGRRNPGRREAPL